MKNSEERELKELKEKIRSITTVIRIKD